MTALEPATPLPLKNVLVPTDFSKGASIALNRALLLPLASNAKVRIVHVLPSNLPAKLRSRADVEARARLEQLLAEARETNKLAAKVELSAELLHGEAFVEIIRASRSFGAELIVIGRHGVRPIRDMFIGTTADRVIRKSDGPVLVVNRKPKHPYRRPMIATDLQEASCRAVEMARRVTGSGVKDFDIVHAFHVPFEGFVATSVSARENVEWTRSFQEQASTGMTKFLKDYEARGIRWKKTLRQGDPRVVILNAAAKRKADLVAVSTHARSGVFHALLGSVAQWIIAAAASDVLVVRPVRISVERP